MIWPQELIMKSEEDTAAGFSAARDPVERWESWTTRAGEWYVNKTLQEADPNWSGRRAMHEALSNGSMWWDEAAENYFLAKIEQVQYPTNCSQVHLFGHRSWCGGLLSNVHRLAHPLLWALMKGHTIVDIDRHDIFIDSTNATDPAILAFDNPAFFGCSPGFQNLNCFFNLSTCSPLDVENLVNKSGLNLNDSSFPYAPWSDLLSSREELFTPGAVTVVTTDVPGTDRVDDVVLVWEANNAGKMNLIQGMMENGKVGVVNHAQREGYNSKDMMLQSMVIFWMLSKISDRVKSIADKIMARYSENGRPAWTPPVLTIHIRQADKEKEDPFWSANGRYRSVSEDIGPMKQLESEFGFKWPTVFLMSDSGSTLTELAREINNCPDDVDSLSMYNSSTAAGKDGKRLIMYDWTSDIHMIQKYGDHSKIPKESKRDMQEHFLATMYITQMISDYAILTYSSNVGRFIGELLSARHRIAMPAALGPVATSLDGDWHP